MIDVDPILEDQVEEPASIRRVGVSPLAERALNSAMSKHKSIR
jgi:hypothetical protein